MKWKDREAAGHLLAKKLARFRGQRPLVLAIPRGGVPIARILARELDGDLDVVLVHKLGAPGNPEFAIGAVSETGPAIFHDRFREFGIDPDYVRDETARQRERLAQRRIQYSAIRPPISPVCRLVLVVDDCTATGLTVRAALGAIRTFGPKKLVAATAAAPAEAFLRISCEADEAICLRVPQEFRAVSLFFEDFAPVRDDAVLGALREAAAKEPHSLAR